MTYPAYIREKAFELRVVKQLSVNEIAERLAISKATIYGWVGDIPLQRERRPMPPAVRAMAETNRKHYAALREAAYQRGLQSWPILSADPTFRDFVSLYVAEGDKRNRNRVALGNSDDSMITLAARWMRTLSTRPLTASVQVHADQDLDEVQCFWAAVLGVEPEAIRLQRKSNSGKLSGRTWRSEHGVLTLWVHDTYFRARMQAWMDCLRRSWV